MWLGNETLEGKTILIVSDEGLGDAMQFARYIPMVARLGARIILVVQDALYPLLSNFPGIAQCVPLSATSRLPDFDFHCSIMSLPLALKTRLDSIPSAISYLPSPPRARVQAWKERLGSHDKLRVGLAWSGNPKHADDHNRSISLREVSNVLNVSATFVSLQKDIRPDDRRALQELPRLIDFSSELTDFVETAALIKCLDLVVTVDTSVAHLAAALGRPTWLLLPYTPDFRWLLDRDDSPWYPSMRLFRQTSSRDWRDVLDRLRTELSFQTRLFGGSHLSISFDNCAPVGPA
jgi:ADP-heptose:LPS heptosyltransferase